MANDIHNDYYPDYAVPPGMTLQETLDGLGMKQTDLAMRAGLSRKTVNQIINGHAALTPEVALKLEMVTGVPARLWNNLEAHYRDTLERLKLHERMALHIPWAKKFPISEMMERGVVALRDNAADQVIEVLRFFGVASPDEWENQWSQIQATYRISPSHPPDSGALAAWFCEGKRRAQSTETRTYDPSLFRAVLERARSLTREPPQVFQHGLVEDCAGGGVAVVFVPEYKGTCAHGATYWLSPDKAMILLSLRYKWADIMWFSFFHEAGHLLLHSKKRTYIEVTPNESAEESEADCFAQEKLIPDAELERLRQSGSYSPVTIKAFADDVGVSPGIIVGRLQHERLIPYSHLTGLRTRLEWSKEQ
jgi:addiction module HigA family antidote